MLISYDMSLSQTQHCIFLHSFLIVDTKHFCLSRDLMGAFGTKCRKELLGNTAAGPSIIWGKSLVVLEVMERIPEMNQECGEWWES